MHFGVVRFPGSNCDEDAHNALCMYNFSLNHNCTSISEAFSSPAGVR